MHSNSVKCDFAQAFAVSPIESSGAPGGILVPVCVLIAACGDDGKVYDDPTIHIRRQQMKSLAVRVFRTVCFVVPALGIFFLLVSPLCAQDAPALYKSKCATCHGPDGSGNVPMGKTLAVPDLTSSDVQKQTDAQLTDSVTNGKGKKMPAYKGKLTDDQIKSLVGFIRERAKKK
jgi:cytochrome c6